MSGHENKLMRLQRDSGALSFYRVNPCKRCGKDTLKDVPFCSRHCYEISRELKMGEGKHWDEAIAMYIGKKVEVETEDGMYLTGKLSKVHVRNVEVGEFFVTLPESLELDYDSEKVVDIERLRRLEAK